MYYVIVWPQYILPLCLLMTIQVCRAREDITMLCNCLFKLHRHSCHYFPVIKQGIYGSARKPARVHVTDYIVDKTDHFAPYLGPYGAYLMPYLPIDGSKSVSIYHNDRWNVAVNSHYLQSGKK